MIIRYRDLYFMSSSSVMCIRKRDVPCDMIINPGFCNRKDSLSALLSSEKVNMNNKNMNVNDYFDFHLYFIYWSELIYQIYQIKDKIK